MRSPRPATAGAFKRCLLRTIALICLLPLTSAPASAADEPKACSQEAGVQDLWQLANRHFNSRRFAQARDCLLLAAQRSPEPEQKSNYLSWAAWAEYRRDNTSKKVEELINHCLDINPSFQPDPNTSDSFLHIFANRRKERFERYREDWRGTVEPGNYKAAEESLQKAALLYRDDPSSLESVQAQYGLASLYKATGQCPRSIELLEKIIPHLDDAVFEANTLEQSLLNLATCYFDTQQYQEAKSKLELVTNLNHDNCLAWAYAARVAAQLGSGVEGAATRARECDPQSLPVMKNVGLAFIESEDLENAERTLTRATHLDANDATVAMTLGKVRAQLGDIPGAIEAYRAAESLATSNTPWVQRQLADLYDRDDKYERSLHYAMEASRSEPASLEAWFRVGRAQRKLERFGEARKSLQEVMGLALAQDPDQTVEAYAIELMNVFVELKLCSELEEVKPLVERFAPGSGARQKLEDVESWCASLHPEP